VPKKIKEVPADPTPKSNPPTITIGSMDAPIVSNSEEIVIVGSVPATTHEETPKVVGEEVKEKRVESNSKYN